MLGELLTVNGTDLEIIGVAPEGFTGTILGVRADVFVPLSMRWLMVPTLGQYNPSDPFRFFNYWLYVFGRLEPGVTLEQADAQLNGLYSGILNDVEAPLLTARKLPPGGQRAVSSSGRSHSRRASVGWGPLRARAERPLELLIGVTALVLLIVCVNIANLLLARGAARSGEMAIRSSLGGRRLQLAKALLSESFVLIAIGGLASLLVAALIVRLISGMVPVEHRVSGSRRLSPTALLFAAGASLATVLVFGLVPAWRVSGANPGQVMNMQGTRAVSGRGSARFRATLTTAQIAFSMVLLVLAGLFTRSLSNISREDLGIDVDSLVNFGITAQLSSYDQAELLVLYDRIEETLAAQPGVTGVGTTAIPLFYDFSLGGNVAIEGIEPAPGADTYAAATAVGSGYFDALDVALMSGRVFTDQRHGRCAARRDRQPGLRAQVQPRRRRGRQASRRRPERRSRSSAWSRTRSTPRSRATFRPLVYYPRRQMAGWLQSLWVYVRGRCRCGHVEGHDPARDGGDRAGRAARHRPDDARAPERQHVHRSPAHDAVDGVRRARDAARGHRPVRRARVQRPAAHARARAQAGARRGAQAAPGAGLEAGRRDGVDRPAVWASPRRSLSARRRVRAVRAVGARPGGDRRRGRRARSRDSGGELAAGVARVAHRADRGVAVRMTK